MPEPIGELARGPVAEFHLEEIGPAIYNKAIADAQARLLGRVSDLNAELYRRRISILDSAREQTQESAVIDGNPNPVPDPLLDSSAPPGLF